MVLLFIKTYNLEIFLLPFFLWWFTFICSLLRYWAYGCINYFWKDFYRIEYFPEDSTSWVLNYLYIYPKRSAFSTYYSGFLKPLKSYLYKRDNSSNLKIKWDNIFKIIRHLIWVLGMIFILGVPFVWIRYVKMFCIYEDIWTAWFYLSKYETKKIIWAKGEVTRNMKRMIDISHSIRSGLPSSQGPSGLFKIGGIKKQHGGNSFLIGSDKLAVGGWITSEEQPNQEQNKILVASRFVKDEGPISSHCYVNCFDPNLKPNISADRIKNSEIKAILTNNDDIMPFKVFSFINNFPHNKIKMNTLEGQKDIFLGDRDINTIQNLIFKVTQLNGKIEDLDALYNEGIEYYNIKEGLKSPLFEMVRMGKSELELPEPIYRALRQVTKEAKDFQDKNPDFVKNTSYSNFDKDIEEFSNYLYKYERLWGK